MAAQTFQAIRGMNDILPEEMGYWHYVEATIRDLVTRYGYQEIRTPFLESTELFARSIGEVTDIVEKEMYTFLDRNQESLTLRPEGTAGCVRAGVEHGLFYNQITRLWYLGPIFRHERPQKGRYRQFFQFGLEAFGMAGPAIDAEIILLNARLWQLLGIEHLVELQLNTLGSLESRAKYREALIAHFSAHREKLDADAERRLFTNPLRILDSKNPDMQELIAQAPPLSDYLDANSQAQFEGLQQLLTDNGVKFQLNPRLVRGLDYYTDTVFEWVTSSLGAQGTVSAGGRYDGLITQLGGKATPGIGFAMGCERVIELLKCVRTAEELTPSMDAYLILVGDAAMGPGLALAEKLRSQLPTLRLMTNCDNASFKSQFKRADRSGAQIALIIAEDELKSGQVSVKFLREAKEQVTVSKEELAEFLKLIVGKNI